MPTSEAHVFRDPEVTGIKRLWSVQRTTLYAVWWAVSDPPNRGSSNGVTVPLPTEPVLIPTEPVLADTGRDREG